MWLDPRIQGRLRVLLEESYESFFKVGGESLDQAIKAIEYAKKGANEFEIAIASLNYGRVLVHQSRLQEAINVYTNVKEYAEKAKESVVLATAHNGIASCYLQRREHERAMKAAQESLKNCRDTEVYSYRWRPLCTLANAYAGQYRLHEALNILFSLKNELEQIDSEKWPRNSTQRNSIDEARYVCYTSLGSVYSHLFDRDEQLQCREQALQIALTNDWKYLAFVQQFFLGVTCGNLDEYDKAIEYFNKVISNIGDTVSKWKIPALNYLARCLYQLKRYDEAESVIEEAYRLSLQPESGGNLSRVLYCRGIIKLAKGESDGVNLLIQALEIIKNKGDTTDLKDILRDLSNYYRSIGDYERVLSYRDQYLDYLEKNNSARELAFSRIHAQQEEERLEQEKKIYQLELEKKNQKLQHQERELTLTASQLAGQAELLGNFRNDLRKIVRDMGDPIDALRHIKQRLKDLPCEQIDWAKFEAEFISVHPEFRRMLHERYPDLTAQETKMCILARIGLKNAEIARLLCLSERSVENHRFNLRKKLGLRTEQNLTQFLATIK